MILWPLTFNLSEMNICSIAKSELFLAQGYEQYKSWITCIMLLIGWAMSVEKPLLMLLKSQSITLYIPLLWPNHDCCLPRFLINMHFMYDLHEWSDQGSSLVPLYKSLIVKMNIFSWQSYSNGKPESSVICQYVCQSVLFVQPIRSVIWLVC